VTTNRRSLIVLVLGFTLLGMPGATLGVAWPSMADDLARSLGDLGVLTIVTGSAYAVMSLASGNLSRRFSAGRMLVGAAAAAAVALALYSIADAWWLLIVASVPLGASGGAIDAIGNSFVAVRRGPRSMGAIHAAFGFGSMLAPLAMTGLIAIGAPWRVGFAFLAGAEVILAIGYLTIQTVIRMPMEGRSERPRRIGRIRVLAMSVWVFFIYAGVEGSTGLWAFTLLTEGQGIDDTIAGLAVAAHWGALFASRLLIGIRGDRMPLDATITASVLGIGVGLAMLWWNPAPWVAIAGLVFAGFANGPVFPFEVMLTSRRFGAEFTPWAVGYQLAAATAAIAIVPALIGLVVNARGPLAIAGVLALLSLVMIASVETLRVISTRSARMPTPVSTP
jgi:fucose permease